MKTRLEQCVEALERAKKKTNSPTSSASNYNFGIVTAIAVITRILGAEPTGEEAIVAKKAYDALDTYGGWQPRMRAALMAVINGGNNDQRYPHSRQ